MEKKKLLYATPQVEILTVRIEQSILSTTPDAGLPSMDPNDLFDEFSLF